MNPGITGALPHRPVSRNELDFIASRDGIRHTMPKYAVFDAASQEIRCFMIVGEGKTVAVGYDEAEQSWSELHRESTPDEVFTGEFITNEDHNHPTIQKIMDAMDEWADESDDSDAGNVNDSG